MAGYTSDFSLPNSSFFNIYTDGGPVARTSPAPSLPGGRCNFVDLTHGANGPKCGCRRFWSRGSLVLNGSQAGLPGQSHGAPLTDPAFCMCSHHACFHDDNHGGEAAATAPQAITTTGQENERPRTNREPLTPVMPEMSFQMPPPSSQNLNFHTFDNVSFVPNLQDNAGHQGEIATPAREPSIPDTLSWAHLIQSQPHNEANTMPPIPSQCLPPSQPSSTTSSSRAGYLRPFGGKGLHTLSGVKSKLREPLPVTEEQSFTPDREPACHDSAEQCPDDLATVTNTPRSTRRVDPTKESQPPTTGLSRETLQELSNTVQVHEQRLDKLETVSFEHDHEACHEQYDRTDLRVTELEVRMDEVEKMVNDGGSVAPHRSHRSGADDATASVVSVSTTMSGRADRAELLSELQALKAQLSYLEASPFPCYARPWDLEVVFLPFPLKGVWYGSRDFPSQRLSGSANADADQWTQLPNSSSLIEPQSPAYSEWAGPELESEWLLPRACPPDKMIDKRLRSRGLIKNVSVRGPDARSVQQAVSTAFGTLFRTFSRMQSNVYHGSTTHHRVAKFLGLQQPWVPLRKIHKDSRLRFLSPAEMITPATWDVSFLQSSVVMKATGVHRLFITQPEAYLQDQDAYDNGWSWQRIRELSRIYPDSQSSQLDVPEADAMEDCWAWNDKLDEHASSQQDSASLSLSLRQAAQPRLKSMTPSQQRFLFTSNAGVSPSLSTGRSRAASPLVTKDRRARRPPHVRTTSMPPSVPSFPSPSQARLRIASATFGTIYPHPHERRASPQVLRASTGMLRKRSTRSPSVPLSARFRATPRWSTSSPSPLPEPFAIVGAAGAGAGCRQTTPFYYATPYSNAPPAESRVAQHRVAAPDDTDHHDHGSDTDEDSDYHGRMDASEDDEEVSDEDGDGDSPMVDLGHAHSRQPGGYTSAHLSHEHYQQQHYLGPEDEPWPGIEDEENQDPEALALDNSIVDVYVDEDAMSDVLDTAAPSSADEAGDNECSQRSDSVPSEYPSTQRAWVDGGDEFKVYEDKGGHDVHK
ncbi:hypothetical protein BX600DRAFT_232644 [Xylariales sp. PMI_506]|nr:hypothetical protein BX600DRAFT_232644 [Xylariales sp. PMI_506]